MDVVLTGLLVLQSFPIKPKRQMLIFLLSRAAGVVLAALADADATAVIDSAIACVTVATL